MVNQTEFLEGLQLRAAKKSRTHLVLKVLDALKRVNRGVYVVVNGLKPEIMTKKPDIRLFLLVFGLLREQGQGEERRRRRSCCCRWW